MDSIIHLLEMWQEEGIIVIAVFAGMVLFHYATKVWNAPAEVMLAIILGVSAGVAGSAVYMLHLFGFFIGTRALCFIGLYLWCVLGMLFFAARNTHRIKLFLGLVSQAGILYALFILL